MWQLSSCNDIPMMAWTAINSTPLDLYNILRHPRTLQSDLIFSDLLFAFVFACKHLEKVHAKYFPLEHLIQYETRGDLIYNIGTLIVQLIHFLVPHLQREKTAEDFQKCHDCLFLHVQLYNKWEDENTKLLQQACENVSISDSMFEVIQLLLPANVDVNIVDQQGNGPLH